MREIMVVAAAADNTDGGGFFSLLPLIIIIGAVVFFVSAQRRRQRGHLRMLDSVRPGAEVVTITGMFATVVDVEDGDVLLEVAPDVVCRFTRTAIGRVLSNPVDDADDEAGDDQPEQVADEVTGSLAPAVDLAKDSSDGERETGG